MTGFVLEKATPFHPLVDDDFLSMKIATFGEYTSFSQTTK